MPRGNGKYGPPWTDERVALLKAAMAEGLSAAMIADRLGDVTRCAVLGKIFRLGIGRGKGQGRNQDNRKPAIMRPRPQRTVIVPLDMALPPPPARHLSLADLTAADCCYPLGDPGTPAFAFCGLPRSHGFPYCGYHAALCYQPPESRERRAFRA